jgi:hypothetical protein
MAVALVGQASNTGTGTPTNIVITRTTNAGNLLVICVTWNTGSSQTVTIADTAGNTWTRASVGWKTGSAGTRAEIWYVINAKAITTATITETSAAAITGHLSEWGGFGNGVLNKTSADTTGGTSTTPTTPTITPTAGDLVVAICDFANTGACTVTTTGSWVAATPNAGASGARCAPAYKLSATTSESETWTITSAVWGAAIASFTQDKFVPYRNPMPQLLAQ